MAEEIVNNIQKLVSQATLTRIKGVLESYENESNVKFDVMIPTRIAYPKPIFLYIGEMEEIPMEFFEWLNDFCKYYDLKYINIKGNLFALYLHKDFRKRASFEDKEESLYSIYETEKKSIIQREKLKEEEVFSYKIKKGM
ncbi:MAG: hypothetical protein ACTSUR_01440 [Candidatus Heimdallarchaeaceae archaeon]